MAEYIERFAASENLYNVYEYVKRRVIADGEPVPAPVVKGVMLRFEKALMYTPAADVAPVVHARWKYAINTRRRYAPVSDDMICSACNRAVERLDGIRYLYCPLCGAKMDKEADHE